MHHKYSSPFNSPEKKRKEKKYRQGQKNKEKGKNIALHP